LHTVSLVHDRSPPQRYALSLHDALPISPPTTGSVASGSPHLSVQASSRVAGPGCPTTVEPLRFGSPSRRRPLPVRHFLPGLCVQDRKSTRLNSSHVKISYAVFCLKKKNK